MIRSFVAIPAGMFEVAFRRFLPSAAAGIVVFCAALAGIGWAAGASWHAAHHYLQYVEVAIVAGILLFGAYLALRRRRSITIARSASDSSR